MLEQPDDAGAFQSRRLRVPKINPARALVSALPARVAGGGARAQGSATIPSLQALRAVHRQCQPAMAATETPRQSSSGA